MKAYIFHVNDMGDRSVGIPPSFSTVTIHTSLKVDSQETKDWIAEYFCCNVKYVITDAEARAEQEAERAYEQESDRIDEEVRNIIN